VSLEHSPWPHTHRTNIYRQLGFVQRVRGDAAGAVAIRPVVQALVGGAQRLLLLAVQARQTHAALVRVLGAVGEVLDRGPRLAAVVVERVRHGVLRCQPNRIVRGVCHAEIGQRWT
jgi:hypothetical protein